MNRRSFLKATTTLSIAALAARLSFSEHDVSDFDAWNKRTIHRFIGVDLANGPDHTAYVVIDNETLMDPKDKNIVWFSNDQGDLVAYPNSPPMPGTLSLTAHD